MGSLRLPLLLSLLVGLAAGGARAEDLMPAGSLDSWVLVTEPAASLAEICRLLPGGGIAVAGRPLGYLATKATWSHYRLHAEWRWTGTPGNSGVLLHIASGPRDRVWPVCFQVQTKHHAVGDLLPMAGATFTTALTTAPGACTPQRDRQAADSEKPAGEWNACDVECRGDTIEVWVNGVWQNRVSGCSVTAGQIGFQLEGTPFELRHVTLTRLD